MKRRTFIAGLSGAVARPAVARAQRPALPVIGYLSPGTGVASTNFIQGLNEQGYVEGRNVEILYRSAENRYDRLPVLVADLVRRRVAVIFGDGNPASALAAKKATGTIPSTVVQGLGACVLAASGTFDQLTDSIVFASWIFYALNTFSLFYFRRKLPAPAYRTPAFPWPPVIFIACSILLIVNTLWTRPKDSLAGLGLIAAGIPVYFLFRITALRPKES